MVHLRRFADLGAPGGLVACAAVALLNDATTQWLLGAASDDRGTASSYSEVGAKAGLTDASRKAVDACAALLLFGSFAGALAAAGENVAAALDGAPYARAATPAAAVRAGLSTGSRNIRAAPRGGAATRPRSRHLGTLSTPRRRPRVGPASDRSPNRSRRSR